VPVSDGPYIFLVNDELQIKWIQGYRLKVDFLSQKNFIKYRKKFGFMFDYSDLKNPFSSQPVHDHSYKNIDSIAVLADIHGDYTAYIRSLRSAGIIDRSLAWSFGTGHLVILGDVFDRGDMVTEVLWHLFGLEKQAVMAGGKVHFLLGNHEMMILEKDNSYLSSKYRQTETISGTGYSELYSGNSVLGRWIRTWPVMLKINDILFVHGGISSGMVSRNLSAEDVNRMFSESLSGGINQGKYPDEHLVFLNDEFGPIWYRGYFNDTTFCENRIDSILNFYGSRHIVVGHTPHPGIDVKFGGRIFGADTGMNKRKREEMLLYKEGVFYRICLNGKRSRIE
jgi:hypothetical protein